MGSVLVRSHGRRSTCVDSALGVSVPGLCRGPLSCEVRARGSKLGVAPHGAVQRLDTRPREVVWRRGGREGAAVLDFLRTICSTFISTARRVLPTGWGSTSSQICPTRSFVHSILAPRLTDPVA